MTARLECVTHHARKFASDKDTHFISRGICSWIARRTPLKLRDLVLRCYAEQEADGTWFTICLALNLYARGDSYEQARQKLHSVIAAYLRDAVTVDSEHIGDLIPRPAPLYFWLRYAFIWCRIGRWRVSAPSKG